MALVALSHLKPGERGTVHTITGTGLFFHRLRALGLRRHAEVALVKRAPFGDPLEIRIRGHHLALRKNEAQHILLSPVSS